MDVEIPEGVPGTGSQSEPAPTVAYGLQQIRAVAPENADIAGKQQAAAAAAKLRREEKKVARQKAAQQNPKLDATENRPGADQTPPEWMMQRNRLRKDLRQRRLTLALEAGEASGDVKLSSTSDQAGGIEAMRAAIEEVDAEMQQAEVASTPAPRMTTDGSGVAQ